MLFLSMMIGTSGCKDNDEEMQENDQITFDNVEILCDVLPPGYYSAVRFTSQNTAYTITTAGKIFKTEDGGNTWTQQDSGTEMHLYDMFFFNDLHGYIVGGDAINEGIILKTTDGGSTWLSANFQVRLSNIYFINDLIGFIAGRKLFKTLDGGTTWNEVDLGYSAYSSINFFDESTGLLSAGNDVLKTIDGGNSWVSLNNINAAGKIQILNNLAFLHNYSDIFKTHDRGNTWQKTEHFATGSVHFINERQAVGVGQFWYELGFFPDGILYITNDGGKHWEEKHFSAEEFYKIEDIDFSNDSTALAVGHTRGCVAKLKF